MIADATRTSILIINKLKHLHSGNYSCVVKHENSSEVYTKLTNLRLNSKEVFTMITYAYYNFHFCHNVAGLEVYFDGITSLNTVLVCEAYGYLSETINFINFKRNGELIVPVQGKYSLTYKEGEKDSIGNDGSPRGSQVIELEIENIQSLDDGVYTCHYSERTVEIVISTGEL